MSQELKITSVEPVGPASKRTVGDTKRFVFVLPCTGTLQDGSMFTLDVTARKKRDLESQRQSMLQHGYKEPGSHFITMRYGGMTARRG